MTTDTASTYHPGERAVQARAGVLVRADHVGRGIRDDVPAVAAAFLEQRRMIVVGAADARGRLWASLLTGPPGFVSSPDAHTVAVAARPHPDDPLAAALAGPARVGMIAVEPETRRRMRVNGTARPDGDGLLIRTEQVYANCPKYIQRRELTAAGLSPVTGGRATHGSGLTAAQQEWIRAADTFFVATSGPDGAADASHRGGNPGFVTVADAHRLRWPEYSGNSMFMTLGNITTRPATGLLFPDWRTGGVLMLTGTARVAWDDDPDGEDGRGVDFTVTEAVELPGLSTLRWGAPEFSPANPPVREA
ncbi:pyridoxamine 5'-phosphate oxidase family protein [Streptomyces sp. NPDC046977]|uniref:pyridoxamine 5'-phosphate oxidase family protein n=1 Tax=Streptomyces sp. NPDC046977 TaxID=3154703 RepID=UPI0033C0C276